MTQIHPCKDNTELTPLYPSRGLYLKPISRINVSVHYPELKQCLTTGGKSISSWDIMERIKTLVSPETFISLRVVKNTLEFIRFEGDLENREILKKIMLRLDGKTMKVTGFKEPLKIRVAESKLLFPSKYDWDSYFRDAKNMNEMKAGERPDTIHFQNLPCKWFSEDTSTEKPLPSEKLFRRIWNGFGEVRGVDIPVCDPYRSQISTVIRGISTFTFSNDNVFEAYVQYKDYMSFVKAMDALRGCYLFYQESPTGKYWVATIKVDFDKSKHLCDDSIKRRKIERERLMEKDKVKKTAEKLSRIESEVKEKKQQDKEKKQSERNLAKIEYKIAMEERKYLIARRKLEAIRLMDYLFETVKRNIVAKAEKKRELQEKTKEETKKFERVMEKYKEDHHGVDVEKAVKVRRVHSLVKVADLNEKIGMGHPGDGNQQRLSGESDDHKTSQPATNGLSRTDERVLDIPGGHFSNRYLGDWEVKARSHGGSEVKVSANYVPVAGEYSGSGRGRGGVFRGRGRHYLGPYPHARQPYHNRGYNDSQPPPNQNFLPHQNHKNYEDTRFDYSTSHNNFLEQVPTFHQQDSRNDRNSLDDRNEQVVHHDFSYLDELDRAYEKYFSSITKRHTD